MAQERPRLLGKRSPQQYTSSTAAALSGEPEAITEEDQRRITTESRAKWAELRGEELARQDRRQWSERLRKAEQRAYDKRIDVHRYSAEIWRQVMLMEQVIENAS